MRHGSMRMWRHAPQGRRRFGGGRRAINDACAGPGCKARTRGRHPDKGIMNNLRSYVDRAPNSKRIVFAGH